MVLNSRVEIISHLNVLIYVVTLKCWDPWNDIPSLWAQRKLTSPLCPFPLWMLSSQVKPRVLAKMDLEVEEKIPQTGVLILFPPAHSLLWAIVGDGTMGVPTLLSIRYLGQWLAWFICFKDFSSFIYSTYCQEFSLLSLNLCVWASGFEHRTYKTINFREKKHLFRCFLLTRFSWVGCSAVSRHVLHIITWPFTCLSICVHFHFRNNALFLLDEKNYYFFSNWTQLVLSQDTWILVQLSS